MNAIPRCGLVAVEGVTPYLRCQMYDGIKVSGEIWRIPVPELEFRQERFICTNDEGYATAENYGRELERWIARSCK
jgi:hypothetical protein